MSKKPIAAILYDFDSTLAITDMQNFGFIPSLGMTPSEFWSEVKKFTDETQADKILSYLYMMPRIAKEKGIKLTREYLNEMGRAIKFFPGVSTWFKRINDYGEEHGIQIEHYIISSGNKEIIDGCPIAKEFKMIYGCEFIYDPNTGEAIWPKMAVNYTQKTQYFYRISKGAIDITDDKKINEKQDKKRIPTSNMIYIGDGMTDVPAMIIVKNSGGKSIAVYPKGNEEKSAELVEDGRVNYSCVADYSAGRDLERIMHLIIEGISINESLRHREEKNVTPDKGNC